MKTILLGADHHIKDFSSERERSIHKYKYACIKKGDCYWLEQPKRLM
jgi:hypothetical protein